MCEWMDAEKAGCAAIILCGDFNGAPGEAFHSALRQRGYVSAHAARHGREPPVRAGRGRGTSAPCLCWKVGTFCCMTPAPAARACGHVTAQAGLTLAAELAALA